MAQRDTSPELLAAARTVFARHGYHGATADRISREAGISRVTLHRRGITKDVLLERLVSQAIESYRASIWPAITGAGTGRERIHTALAALCDSAERDLGLLVALRTQSNQVFHDDGTDVLTRTVFTEPLERLLRDGASDGSLRALDPVETATVLFNMIGWTYVHLRTEHGWPPERARTSVVDLAMCGLSAPIERPPRRKHGRRQ